LTLFVVLVYAFLLWLEGIAMPKCGGSPRSR
jgi:hypothetical protein